jgi:hypothetical protein
MLDPDPNSACGSETLPTNVTSNIVLIINIQLNGHILELSFIFKIKKKYKESFTKFTDFYDSIIVDR